MPRQPKFKFYCPCGAVVHNRRGWHCNGCFNHPSYDYATCPDCGLEKGASAMRMAEHLMRTWETHPRNANRNTSRDVMIRQAIEAGRKIKAEFV